MARIQPIRTPANLRAYPPLIARRNFDPQSPEYLQEILPDASTDTSPPLTSGQIVTKRTRSDGTIGWVAGKPAGAFGQPHLLYQDVTASDTWVPGLTAFPVSLNAQWFAPLFKISDNFAAGDKLTFDAVTGEIIKLPGPGSVDKTYEVIGEATEGPIDWNNPALGAGYPQYSGAIPTDVGPSGTVPGGRFVWGLPITTYYAVITVPKA
jgi:hypothetical protein